MNTNIDTPSENGAPHGGQSLPGGTRPPTGTPAGRHISPASAGDGLPSDAELTRMVNAMFAALPGTGNTPPSAGSGTSTPFNSASSSKFGADEEQRLHAALTPRVAGAQSDASKSLPSLPAAAAAPTARGGGALPATPSPAAPPASPFYFLSDAQAVSRGSAPPGFASSAIASPPSATHSSSRRPFDVNAVRRDFPILQQRVNGGKPLVWLDNAATTHKPQAVIERLVRYYQTENSNIHRAAHELAARSTDAYEAARTTVARFLNAPSSKEIVFVRGATEAINLVAHTWGRQHVGPDDEILITHLEHHANIVPWQRLCAETGATLRVCPVDDRGQVILTDYQRLLTRKVRLVAFPQVSNALGTVTPAQQMVEMAHRAGALTLVDGAQSVAHLRQDVAALDADFFVFSGHKIFAPTGIGVLYGKAELLDAMQPWQGGGNMIEDVTIEQTTYQAAPARFEAGTGSIADAVGLGAALEYLESLGMENISRYEHDLMVYATSCLQSVRDLRLIGTAPDKAGVLSFVIDGLRTEDIGAALSHEGIAVRAGHHCAQPILRRFGLESTVRPSLAMYNTHHEIDVLTAALKRIRTGVGAGRV